MTLVKFNVDQAAINKTDKCRNAYSCLSGGKECICSVKDSFNGTVLFINPRDTNICSYMMSFGYSYVCNCPTRKEIFKKYKE